MSTKASAVQKVDKVEIDLSEKGLTDLAKMLVQSGRMSAPSFTNWCSRISPQASRWARALQDPSKTGKAQEKSDKKGKDSKTIDSKKDGNKSGNSKQSIKDGLKLSGLKKAWPNLKLTSWKEDVLEADEAQKILWYESNKRILNVQDRKAAAQAYLTSIGLTEDEKKASRAWFPLLPGKEEKDLYDQVDISAMQVIYDGRKSGKSGTDQTTGGTGKPAPSIAWKGGTVNKVTTGTSQQVAAKKGQDGDTGKTRTTAPANRGGRGRGWSGGRN